MEDNDHDHDCAEEWTVVPTTVKNHQKCVLRKTHCCDGATQSKHVSVHVMPVLITASKTILCKQCLRKRMSEPKRPKN
jgi:hypothetical protein